MMKILSVILVVWLLFSAVLSLNDGHVFAVQLHPSASADDIAERHGFDNLGNVEGVEHHYLFKLRDHPSLRNDPENFVREKADMLSSSQEVLWVEKQVARERTPRPRF
eukprot:TRINITY_DN5665_c0_g1_i4.p1 TRINITY_DN5665_c0_g1~~TRINITY_DN5665_c0_g1_i4.p1  ORF type:complete len:108 (-),score=23.53 TRINITY_DN5665_c0_g1_i4:280-603(-)